MSSESMEAYLRPRARLMSTLGEELISNERVALTELVKNAYDADASLVVIRFMAPLAKGAGSIEVWDDGHGMSAETLRGTWLEIATPYRHRSPRSERLGRRVLGAKGIGRFASARLAHVTSLTTRRSDDQEVALRVAWGDFSKDDAYLDQVPVWWSQDFPKVFAPGGAASRLFARVMSGYQTATGPRQHVDGQAHGTVVRLEGLCQSWDAESITTLKGSLSRLLPPPPPTELSVPEQPEFAIYVETPPGDLEHLSGFLAASETLAHPHYRLVGSIDETGFARLTLQADDSSVVDVSIERALRRGPTGVSCGPLELDIRAWDLEAPALRHMLKLDLGARKITDVRSLIHQNSGVALYRDGFRVQPFGESGYDWLAFDKRRVNNPTLRLSNNQVSGFVYITADDNPRLQDRSHREGLIDSPEYEALKLVLQHAVNELETWRYRLRRPDDLPAAEGQDLVRQPEGGSHGVFEKFNLDPLRTLVNERHPDDAVLGRALEEASEAINEGVKKVQEVLSQFSRLATLGSLVDMVCHDGRTALFRIGSALRELKKLVRWRQEGEAELTGVLNELHAKFDAQNRALDRLFTRIEPLGGRRRGRPREISLHEAIREAVAVYERQLDKRGIEITIGGDDVVVTAEPGDIHQVVINLVGNAIYWVSSLSEEEERHILIEVARTKDGEVDITVSDSGPGVREEIKDLIFDTYFSDKPDGIGLGLSIVGSVVKDFYDGDVYLVSPGPLSGASFKVRLRRRVG